MNPLGGRQKGVVAILVAIGLLALLAMVGLALDSGHAMLNKSRLQNTVDASALAAAKVLDSTGSEANADAVARDVFNLNAANLPELTRVMNGADLTIQFSNTLNPWAPGTAPANYVRVIADDFTMWTSFTSLVGITETRMAASAVAGPSAPVGNTEGNEACDLTPMMVCADMSAGAPGDFGYTGENVTLLKMASNVTGPIGPGNFQLFELGGAGANIVRQNLAGAYNQCIDPGGEITTKPGNNTGPTAQGLNTRFGKYQGGGMNSTQFPPDKVTTQPSPDMDTAGDPPYVILRGTGNTQVTDINQVDYTYEDYAEDLESGPFDFPNGVAKRRVLAVPFVDCSTAVNGQGTIPVVGLGCFFLLQEVIQKGNEDFVFAQYIGDCGAGGTPGPEPNPNPEENLGVYKIVLHNDPLSPDS
jgi:Flp pilus assembly protein TadG